MMSVLQRSFSAFTGNKVSTAKVSPTMSEPPFSCFMVSDELTTSESKSPEKSSEVSHEDKIPANRITELEEKVCDLHNMTSNTKKVFEESLRQAKNFSTSLDRNLESERANNKKLEKINSDLEAINRNAKIYFAKKKHLSSK